MKTPIIAENLTARALTSLAAIAAVSIIFGAKALEHQHVTEATAAQVVMAPANTSDLH